jgi:DNA repair/transcription protein MET18/MMS19
MSQDFVFGLIQQADQERDPRNLLILFSIFPVVARFFRLEPFTEEFFEVFSCYFPIDFTPVKILKFKVDLYVKILMLFYLLASQ